MNRSRFVKDPDHFRIRNILTAEFRWRNWVLLYDCPEESDKHQSSYGYISPDHMTPGDIGNLATTFVDLMDQMDEDQKK